MFEKYKKGQEAVLRVQLRAAQLGMIVSMPTTEERYDLLLDDGKRIYRVQVKYTSRQVANGSVELDLRKETRSNGKKRAYSAKEIDLVLVYVPQIDGILWLESKVFADCRSLTFRFEESRNRQKKKVRMTKDFVW
jgi:hypothetical protein